MTSPTSIPNKRARFPPPQNPITLSKTIPYPLQPLTPPSQKPTGIVGEPATELLGYEGVEGAVGPRFRTLSKEEIEDYLTNL